MASSRERWESLSTPEIHKYLQKYGQSFNQGKCPPRRRKKIRYLQDVLARRQRAAHLLMQSN